MQEAREFINCIPAPLERQGYTEALIDVKRLQSVAVHIQTLTQALEVAVEHLDNIKKHQEALIPNASIKLSDTYCIADKGIKQINEMLEGK